MLIIGMLGGGFQSWLLSVPTALTQRQRTFFILLGAVFLTLSAGLIVRDAFRDSDSTETNANADNLATVEAQNSTTVTAPDETTTANLTESLGAAVPPQPVPQVEPSRNAKPKTVSRTASRPPSRPSERERAIVAVPVQESVESPPQNVQNICSFTGGTNFGDQNLTCIREPKTSQE
ncbi:MAG: hypothetical protein JO238_09555 [Alphaproteobacteria bacterium]|nr:hypothetical protein [Alphaproteobacteria bacterium]